MKRTRLCKMAVSFVLLCVLSGCTGGAGTSLPPVTAPEPVVGSETQNTLTESGQVQAESSQPEFPTAYMVETENRFDYQPGLECSAFASAYLLRHYGEEADGLELFKDFPNKLANGGGVYPWGIVNFFMDRGYSAVFVQDGTVEDIKRLVSGGTPVIVYIHVAEPTVSVHYTHYVPIVGYDEDYFYFAESLADYSNCKDEEGLAYNRKTEISTFLKLWANVEGFYENPYFLIS